MLLSQLISISAVVGTANLDPFGAHINFANSHHVMLTQKGSSTSIKDTTKITVIVAIKIIDEQYVKYLEHAALRVGDPTSQVYGFWMDSERVQEILPVEGHGIMADEYFSHATFAEETCKKSGATWSMNKFGDLGKFTGSVSCIETVFYTHLKEVQAGDKTVWRTAIPMKFPDRLKDVLDGCSLNAPVPKGWGSSKTGQAPQEVSRPQNATTPQMMAEMYGVPFDKPINQTRNVAGVLIFSREQAEMTIEEFYKANGITSGDSKNFRGDGCPEDYEGSVELRSFSAIAPGGSINVYQLEPSDEVQEPILSWLFEIHNDTSDSRPIMYSLAYSEDEGLMPPWFIRRVNQELMKLAAQGVTVFVSSGDDGAFGSTSEHAAPQFPASSPWVTTVGATQLWEDGREHVCQRNSNATVTSGGGFSQHAPRLSFQEDAVNNYLKSHSFNFTFNPQGAAYPDISVSFGRAGGAMGLFAQLNELLLAQGKPQLGFLNPLLYYLRETGFHDVTVGDNGHPCADGFVSAPGWNAASGLGSPKFEVFVDFIKRLHKV